MLKVNLNGPLIKDRVNFAILVNGNIHLLRMDNLSGQNEKTWNYAPVDFILTSQPGLSKYSFTLGIKNIFNEKYTYPGYGYNAPFNDWNVPDYMVPDSRVNHPGLSGFIKIGVDFSSVSFCVLKIFNLQEEFKFLILKD